MTELACEGNLDTSIVSTQFALSFYCDKCWMTMMLFCYHGIVLDR